ncbi:hypothetical protein D3C81_2222450 [compost metagenome]
MPGVVVEAQLHGEARSVLFPRLDGTQIRQGLALRQIAFAELVVVEDRRQQPAVLSLFSLAEDPAKFVLDWAA